MSPVVEGMGCPGDGRIIRLAGRRDDRGVYVGWVSSKWVMWGEVIKWHSSLDDLNGWSFCIAVMELVCKK